MSPDLRTYVAERWLSAYSVSVDAAHTLTPLGCRSENVRAKARSAPGHAPGERYGVRVPDTRVRDERARRERAMSSRSTRVTFVLSGGGSLGAVQAGMLHALYENGVKPDMIVGTSAGAINGAFIASRAQSVDTALELAAIWRGLRRGDVFPLRPLSGLLGFLGSHDHVVPQSGLRSLVGAHLQRERLEDMLIPLHVVAVDVISGEELLLSSGPAQAAVLASAAIPGVLPPVEWEERG
jgi:predicted acylesterase/phospholipase RssA